MKITSLFCRTTLLISLVAGALHSAALGQTPIYHWTFDEGINDYSIDSSDNTRSADTANDATWQTPGAEGLTYTAGQIGGAAVLDGNGPTDTETEGLSHSFLVGTLSDLDGVDQLSISAWVRESSDTGYKGLVMTRTVEDAIGTSRNWGIAIEGNNADTRNADGRTGFGGLDSNPDLSPGEWYHIVLTWTADADNFGANPRRDLYVNGVLNEAAEESPGDITNLQNLTSLISSGSWFIGVDPDQLAGRSFEGAIDDVAIYDTALSSTQVSDLYDDGTNGINAVGQTSGTCGAGDVDCAGGATITDFNTIRTNYNTAVDGRNDGDLNGDAFVDIEDYLEWALAAPPNLVASVSFNPVPEPATAISLVILLGLTQVGSRRRVSTLAVLLVIGLTVGTSCQTASAQDIFLRVNWDTNDISIVTQNDAEISINGYQISSALGSLNNATWQSFQSGQSGATVPWSEAGTPSRNSVAELRGEGPNGGSTTFMNQATSLGAFFDPNATVKSDAGFGVEVDDLQFRYNTPSANPGEFGQTLTAPVVYEGEKIFNSLVLIVDLINDTAIIKNESATEVDLLAYNISTTNGTFDTNWTGRRTGDANWQAAGASGTFLAELNTDLGDNLMPGESVSLGNIFTPDGKAGDLVFDFAVSQFDEPFRDANNVKYITTDGDFDFDGNVDGADFLQWQRSFSSNPANVAALDGDDLQDWQGNYGGPGNISGSLQAVPEPASALLLFAGTLGFVMRRTRK